MKKALALLVMISVVYGVSAQVEYKYINKLPIWADFRRKCSLVTNNTNQLELKKECDVLENKYISYAQKMRQRINNGVKEDIEKNFNNPEELKLFFQSTDWQNAKKDFIREEVKREIERDVAAQENKQMNPVTYFLLSKINQKEFVRFERDMISFESFLISKINQEEFARFERDMISSKK